MINDRNDTVFYGKITEAGTDFLEGRIGYFSDLEQPGKYVIKVDNEVSRRFDIGDEVAGKYYDLIYQASVNWFLKQRSGNTVLNWVGIPIHTDDGRRSDNGKWQDFSGGWNDAADRRKFIQSGPLGVMALSVIKENLNPEWDTDNKLFQEIKWGNDLYLKMQDPEGFLYSHSKSRPNDEAELTDNVNDTFDDRLFYVDRVALCFHFIFIAAQVSIFINFRHIDAEYTEKCLNSAINAFRYCQMHFDEMNKETVEKDPIRKYHAKGSDMRADVFDNYACGILAGIQLYKATMEDKYLNFAVDMADRLMNLQEMEFKYGQEDIFGYFYQNEEKNSFINFKIANEFFLIGLCELMKALPQHKRYECWKLSLRSFVYGFLLPLTHKNAYRIFPFGLFNGNTKNSQRNLGSIYYKFFKHRDEFETSASGRVASCLALAYGLTHVAELFGDHYLLSLAWAQIHWILGCNPFDLSGISGFGYNQFPHFAGYPNLPVINGGVRNGINGDEMDMPQEPDGSAMTCEYWIPNQAYLLMTLSKLLKHNFSGN